MNDAQRIEEKLRQELKIVLHAPINFPQFVSYMSELSRGQIDPQITEEIWGQMTDGDNTPTMRRFPGIFLEAIQRIDGKLVQLDQQIREARDVPSPIITGNDFSPNAEYLVFRAVEITAPADPGLLFEFEQNGKTARTPYAKFRHHDALLRGYDRLTPLRVRLIHAVSGNIEATFEIFYAEAGHGSRATAEKLLPTLDSQCTVFCQLQTLRSASEYALSVRTFNEENLSSLQEIRGEFRRIRDNIGMVFSAEVINYARLPPLLFDTEGQLNFRNNALHGYVLLDLVEALAAEQYSAQSKNPKDKGTHSMRSYEAVPPTSAAPFGLSGMAPAEVQRLPMNLSPFAASGTAAASTPPAASSDPFAGGFNATWNPKFEFIFYLCIGLSVTTIVCSTVKASFLSLFIALTYIFWHYFRNDHIYHLIPLFFIVGFFIALLLDFLWLITQFRWTWIRGGSGGQGIILIDRFFSLFILPSLALQAALIYFFLVVHRQGVYISSGGPSNALKRPPFNLAF